MGVGFRRCGLNSWFCNRISVWSCTNYFLSLGLSVPSVKSGSLPQKKWRFWNVLFCSLRGKKSKNILHNGKPTGLLRSWVASPSASRQHKTASQAGKHPPSSLGKSAAQWASGLWSPGSMLVQQVDCWGVGQLNRYIKFSHVKSIFWRLYFLSKSPTSSDIYTVRALGMNCLLLCGV